MTQAPERIWATGQNAQPAGRWWHETELKNGIEYIRAALGPQWQPIETAPKDGTKLILFCGDTCSVFAPCEWSKAGEISKDGFWLWWQAEPDILTEIRRPTRWMLPPKTEAV